jgi:aspartate ammonia-lyase
MTQPIKGYRELSPEEIETINLIKRMGENIGEVVEAMKQKGPEYDQRWVSVGRTHLQQGLMALTRAVAQPTNF